MVRDTGRSGLVSPPRGFERRPLCVAGRKNGNEPASKRRTRFSDKYLSVPLGAHRPSGSVNVNDPEGGRPFEAENCHLLLQVPPAGGGVEQAGPATEQ